MTNEETLKHLKMMDGVGMLIKYDEALEKAAQIFSKNKKSVFFKREALLKNLKNKGLNVYYDAAMDVIYIVDFDALLLSEDLQNIGG